MLVNPQGMDLDSNNPGGCGMVCMLYFKEDGSLVDTSEWDGKTVDVEWYSTIKDQYYKDENQFRLNLDLYDGGVATEKYGVIPAEYLDAEKYPFVTFGYDSDIDEFFFHNANSHWTTSEVEGVYPSLLRFSTKKTPAYVLLRRDFDAAEAGDVRYKGFGNMSLTVNLDLGGHQFTSSAYVFDANLSSASTTTINVYGDEGSAFLVGGSSPLFWLGTNKVAASGASFTYNFDGIRFGYAEGATAKNMLAATFSASGASTAVTTQNINFNDCVFDLTNKPSDAITLLNLSETEGDAYSVQSANVRINGGSLIANATSDVTLYSANDTDSVIFASGESGAVTLTLPADASAPAYNCYGENGKTYVFELTDEGEDTDTYTLTEKAVESKGEIDIWLIGGQSNAVGYGNDTLTVAASDSRYSTGFENVLFYGNYESNWCPDTFVLVKMGLGKQGSVTTTVGAEIGMAAVLSNSSGMNAIIKHAWGSSYLYPNTSHSVSQTYGTWTPPSYIEANGVDTEGNKIGGLYNAFIDTVTEGIAMLVADGYTPVIRGMWWMQGEAETGTLVYANSYEELLTTLISDVRRDLGSITGEDLSDMPFVMGKISINQTKDSNGEYVYSQQPYINTVNAAQVSVTSSVANTYVVDTSGLRQLDKWHYSADGQHYLGEQFINTVIASEGKFSVTLNGSNVTMSDGGAKSAGESVTVTITANPGCVINSVKYAVGNGEGALIELDTNGEYTFVMPDDNVVFEVNAIDPNAETTKYGIIPSMYVNGENYPFIIFMDGKMLGAYTNWSDAAIASTTFIYGKNAADKEAQILLRSNYSVQTISGISFAYIGGTLVLDLDGYTLTSGDSQIFNALGKATDGFVHDSKFIVKDGRIEMNGGPAVAFNNVSDESYNSRKNFYFTFDNVTFCLASGYETWHGLVVDCYDNGTVGCNGYITLNNCKIDLKTVEPTKELNIFDLSDVSNKNNVYVTVGGGSFDVSDSFDTYVNLYASNAKNAYGEEKVVFAKDSSGNYPVFISDTALGARAFESENGKLLELGEAVTDGENKVYGLVESNAVATAYGIIPESVSDADTYPFVLFSGGKYVNAFKTYYNFLTYVKSTGVSAESTLLLRKEYYSTDSDAKVSNNDRNLVYLKAPLTIDLGGNTIERGANGQHLFQFFGLLDAAGDDNAINVTVKNGYVHVAKNSTAPIVFNNSATGGTEIFNVTFENVTFTSLSGNGGQIVAAYTGGDASVGNIVFNGCTFDLTTMTGVAFNLFESDTVNKVDLDVQLNGCNIIMGSATAPTLLKLSAERENGKGSPDSMTFGEFAGKKTTLTLASSIIHNIVIETAGGTLTSFANPVASGNNLVYTAITAAKLAENTTYGTISENYPAEIYPFALFDGNTFVAAYRTWYHFLAEVSKSTFSGYRSGCTLLLRRDYSTDECQASSQNLYHIDDLVLDLGGHTFTKAAKHIFQAYGKDTSTTPSVTNITVKNGTMLAKTAAIVIFNNAATVGARAQFNFTFVNVEFGFAIGASATSMIVENYDNGTIGSDSSVVLKNCTINLKGDADSGIISPTKNVTIFNLKEKTANKNHTSVKVIGGEIIANSLSKVTLYTLNDATEIGSDSVVFAKEENANYTSLVLQSGAESPTAEYNGFVFVKISDDGLTATYRLRPAEVANIDFVPKMSLTLDRDLILNVYVPAKDFLAGFTLDGVDYTDLAVLKKVTLGAEDYYLVSISLDAKSAARDVVLRAKVALGDKTASATFTFGIVKYAEKILADGSDAEKTLVKDVLSYVRAAYAYFGTNDAQTVSRINTILGDNYDANNAPTVEGSATAETAGLKSATFVLDGTPAMRFYLADGADASKYAFFIDDTRVKTETSADGKYIDIDVYAYALCETVTYTIDGVESGSFHIRAYYEWSKTQNNDNLVNLTARFWKYLQSARDYRDSVVEG